MQRIPDLDLGSLSLRQLRELLIKVDAILAEKTVTEQEKLRQELMALADRAGYSLDELFEEVPKARQRRQAARSSA